MVIVAGHLVVHEDDRAGFLAGCADVVAQARAAPGCLDFALTADLIDPGRVDVYERWDSRRALDAFRGSGPSGGQAAAIRAASVAEYDVTGAAEPG